MKKKIVDYTVTAFTLTSSVLLILMLFVDLVNYDVDIYGTFVLDVHKIAYFWPNGQAVDSKDIVWVAPGLIISAILMLFPVLLIIMKKKATLFFWGNIVILGIVIVVQNLALDYATSRIFNTVDLLPDEEYLGALYYPYYSLGLAIIAAVIYTFYGRKLKGKGAV
jgi:uncharacterized metal-binding protein